MLSKLTVHIFKVKLTATYLLQNVYRVFQKGLESNSADAVAMHVDLT